MAVMIVLTSRAERSAGLINSVLADFERTMDPVFVEVSLRRSPRLRLSMARRGRSSEPNILRTHGAILRLVAIAEEFGLWRLIELTEAVLPRDDLIRQLWESELGRFESKWPSRISAWKNLHQIDIRQRFPFADALDGFIASRNIVAHGLGSLTRKQKNNPKETIKRLNAARLQLNGDSLVISDSDVKRCASTMEFFVDWLDISASIANQRSPTRRLSGA